MFAIFFAAYKEFVRNSWWVVLFILACFIFYEKGTKQREQDFLKLHRQYVDLQKEKKQASATQEDLLLQINSQSDPAWIELTLIKVLGLAPEEQIKAIFTNSSKE